MKKSQSKIIQNLVLGGILVLLLLAVCRLFTPFFSVILWSTLFYIIFSPLHHRLVKNLTPETLKGKLLNTLYAALFSLGTILVIVIPLCFVGIQLVKQGSELVTAARTLLIENPGTIKDLFRNVSTFISDITNGNISISPEDIIANAVSSLSSVLQSILHIGNSVVRNAGTFIVNLAFMVLCLFFFYLNGKELLRMVKRVVPIRAEYKEKLVTKFKEIAKSLFLGYIIVGIIQAVVAYIIFLIFQVKGALVFSILIIFFSFIPMIGPVFIWLPVGIFRVLSGNVGQGIVFMAICAATVSSLDNILRPLFLKDRIKLHPLIIFFAILGGVSVFGFNGLILGPMAVILFLTVLDLFMSEFNIEQDENLADTPADS